AEDATAAAREKLSSLEFPAQLVLEQPEEETAEEKPNMGLVKLSKLPALDGFCSHGMFARTGRTAQPSDYSCARRDARAKPAPSNLVGVWAEVARVIANFSQDLQELLGQMLPSEMAAVLEKKAPLSGEALPPGELPFDVSKHPTCKVAHAQRSLSRWSEDMAFFRDRAASTKQYSLKLKTGGQWPSLDALAQLQKKVAALKESDEAAVSEALTVLLKAAGAVEETSSEDRVEMRLPVLGPPGVPQVLAAAVLWSGLVRIPLRHVALRQTEGGLADGEPLPGRPGELQLLSDLAVLVMLRASRLGLLSRSLEELSRVQVQVQALEAGEPLESRRLLLAQASASLAATLRSKRAYAPGDLEGSYDPRFLAFEFTRNLLLRENQVNLVQDFISTLENKEGGSAMVKQMIMGQGKTTVVCPMLVLMLANGEQLVVLVVPSALLDMSRRVLRSTFASVLTKDVGTFECERSSAFDPHLLKKLEKAKQSGAAVVTVPTSVKSLMLRMLET
ncbi:unnamed protein product, partial [Effrenium voratum]